MSVKNTAEPITIALVDDADDVRLSLEVILHRRPAFRCVGSFETAEAALEAIPKLNPRLVLMDINLPGMSGIDCVRLLSEKVPDTQFVMLTVYDNNDDIFNSLSAGAIGYLLKPVRAETLISAIEEFAAGGAPMSTKIARRVIQTFKKTTTAHSGVADLTTRERDVLELLAKGFQSKEIAPQLGVSFWTIEERVANIYKKLHVRSRAEAVAKYLGT